jgi:DNA-binding transcriptional ArsR family regulator
MSRRPRPAKSPERTHAPVFAALGDRTRLLLVGKLSRGAPCSISELTDGFKLTRQAVTKHLYVLETAGVVHSTRQGREIRFEFTPGPVEEARKYLESVSQQWGDALGRLKAFVESKPAKRDG